MSRLTINGLSRPAVAPVHLSRPAPGIIAALFCGYFAVGLSLPVIVISASEDARDVREALAKGALGYVPKSASQHTLLSAIRLVLDGDLYVPPLILGEVPLSPAPDPRGAAAPAGSVLTRRQIDVLKQLSQGKSNKSIALELGLSEKTVKAHVTAIFNALNVINRTQAAAAGQEAGLI